MADRLENVTDEVDEQVVEEIKAYGPPAAAAALVHADPLDVRRLPLVPGATDVMAEVPAPTKTDAAV